MLRTTEQLVFELAQETICNVINVFLGPPNTPTSANQTSAVCGQGKVRVQRVFKEEDNYVLSFPEWVIYCASGWQGVLKEKVLKHVWFRCCTNTSRQNLTVSKYFLTYTSHVINLDHAPWRKAPSNKLVKGKIELWFCGICQSPVILYGRVKSDLAEGTDPALVRWDVGRKALTRVSSATQARDMMMYYLWCLGSTGNGHRETSNTPSSTNYNLGASMPAGGFSIQASAISKRTQSFVSIPHSPICPLIHVPSHSIVHNHSFPSRRLWFPFTKQKKLLADPHRRDSLFSKESAVYVKCGIYYYIMHYADPISRKRLNNVSNEQHIW